MNNITPERRNHRPMRELCEDELLRTIRKQWQDASEARTELLRRGWSDVTIDSYTADPIVALLDTDPAA